MAADGAALFKKCASCHGVHGEKKAFGKSAVIQGTDVAERLAGYKAGTLNQYNFGKLMHSQVSSYSDDDIAAVAAYIKGL